MSELHDNKKWFTKARFGMFIHWGLYSLAADWEWLQHRLECSTEEYSDKYFNYFEPDLFEPEQWADAAANAGMKYMVITAKHHENLHQGECL
jgi:alpha-L-fucosidase